MQRKRFSFVTLDRSNLFHRINFLNWKIAIRSIWKSQKLFFWGGRGEWSILGYTDTLNPFTPLEHRSLGYNISFFVGLLKVASCHWYVSNTNNRNLGKLYMVCLPNVLCISHPLLIEKRTPVDFWRHNFAFLVTFNLEKLTIFLIQSREYELGPLKDSYLKQRSVKTWLQKFQLNALNVLQFVLLWSWFDRLISIFHNVQDHKLDRDTVDTVFNGLFVKYALFKKRGLLILETVWSTWKLISMQI